MENYQVPDPDRSAWTGAVHPITAVRPLSIAVINNMPDAALRVTERRICGILAAASDGMLVDVKFYSLDEVTRSEQARKHIAACYERIEDLWRSRPDGLIVTGTEPAAASLLDEPLWQPLCELIDWSEAEAIPSIWSCFAAHAAVMRLDGVQRIRLAHKLSGLFRCTAQSSKHQIMHSVPYRWAVPHSRWNALNRKDLEAQGYTILSHAGAAGVDMFMKPAPVLQLFMQGHLEYGSTTLLGEYRRDVLRAAAVDRPAMPVFPLNIVDRSLASLIQREAQAIIFGHRADQMPRLDLLLRAARPSEVWAPVAQTFFRNWLSYLDVFSTRSTPPAPSLPGSLIAAVNQSAKVDAPMLAV